MYTAHSGGRGRGRRSRRPIVPRRRSPSQPLRTAPPDGPTARGSPGAEQPAVREVELPWWAIALPAVVFAALLLLLVGPSDAQAAEGSTGHVARFVVLLRDSIVQLLS